MGKAEHRELPPAPPRPISGGQEPPLSPRKGRSLQEDASPLGRSLPPRLCSLLLPTPEGFSFLSLLGAHLFLKIKRPDFSDHS